MSLNLTGITLTYPDGDSRLTALDQVSLDVPRGSLTAIAGPSGSGKSSLLAVAATLITPDTGTVTIDGTDTTGMTRRQLTDLRRHKIGIVFQQPNLLSSLTAAEQLQVMAQIDGRSPGKARGKALDLLDAVGLAGEARRRPHQLSGGQRQRVNIARALMNDPTVLLIDEPTSALDHDRGAAVIDLITRLTHQQATATVLVTHDRAHLTAVDQIAEVADGRLTESRRLQPSRLA
ncbi:ABC transporter ATP-binding protein [Prauserella marina]|uniref:Putative ABC transport system ATP-binding protein n=1 Tax=Prauserella marina TaxID=530584 RepID=A0A222VPE5_9PSEU|nr:ABC transporter ATP-binding protein [Prauserella marina]ASR35722.1 ABC transporter ATP-binding protein [Prauserella marina]PWV84397.1 putative ABC transport system ATP-binding protein [Prauserella marina]SDC23599.1 putative ABC transport system ATP-binding protein [Prauserella marina]